MSEQQPESLKTVQMADATKQCKKSPLLLEDLRKLKENMNVFALLFSFWGKVWLRAIDTFTATVFFAGVMITLSIQRRFFSDDPLPSNTVFYLLLAIMAILLIFTVLHVKDLNDESERIKLEANRMVAESEQRIAETDRQIAERISV